jgi:hypothetical protein
MEKFLASSEWQWRLLRTIAQGVLGSYYSIVQRRVNEMLA